MATREDGLNKAEAPAGIEHRSAARRRLIVDGQKHGFHPERYGRARARRCLRARPDVIPAMISPTIY